MDGQTTLKSREDASEQGRKHGNPAVDGWAGAVVRKSLRSKMLRNGPTDRQTDRPTRQGEESRVRD